jgi:hypothetical protein
MISDVLILQLNIVRTSNIMSIDTKPFDPKTYEAQEPFTTEVEGQKQHSTLASCSQPRWNRICESFFLTPHLQLLENLLVR